MAAAAPSHVRIGRIQDQLEKIIEEAQEARHLSERYAKEGNQQMATYWESQYDFAQKISMRMSKAFNLQTEHAV